MNNKNFLQPLKMYKTSLIVDVVEDKEYCYSDFSRLIDCVSEEIELYGLTKHSIVIIYGYRNAFKTMLLFFSCIKIDLVPFIVEYGNFDKLQDLKFNAVISEQYKDFNLYKNLQVVPLSQGYLSYNFNKDIYIGSTNDLVIVSSSGTTSAIPQKILLGNRQTIFNIHSNKEALGLNELDTTLVLLPLSYSYGLIAQFLTHLFAGANIILADKVLGILQIDLLLKKYSVTNVFMTPLLARLLIYYNHHCFSYKNNLRFVTIGGDKPHVPTLNKLHDLLGCEIYGTYGLAEAGPRVATNKFDLTTLKNNGLSIGQINPRISVSIQKSTKYQKICGLTEIGHLKVNSKSIYLGYIQGNKLQKPKSDSSIKTKDICTLIDNKIVLLGRENQYVFHNGNILWFNQLSQHFYEDAHVLKVKIKKNIQNQLNIVVYHRNVDSVNDLKESFEAIYDFKYDSNYVLELVEFNNTQYK